MGESEDRFTPEEQQEIDRILDLLPKEGAGISPPAPAADAKKARIKSIESEEPEFEEFPAEEPAGEEGMESAVPAEESIEDITDLLEVVEEPAEAAPPIEEISAEELGAIEEPAPEEAEVSAVPEEEVFPEAEGEGRTPLDELDALTAGEGPSVDIQDISPEARPAARTFAPAEKPLAMEELPELPAEDLEAIPEMRFEKEADMDVPDLSDITMKEGGELPVAEMEEIPEIGVGEVSAAEGLPSFEEEAPRGAAAPADEFHDEFHMDDIPAPLEPDREAPAEFGEAPEPAREDLAGVPRMEEIEDIVRSEEIPEEEPEEVPPPRRRAEPVEEEATDEGEEELSSRDLNKLKTAMLLFPPALRRAVKDSILGDALPQKDVRQLIEMILTGKPEDNIHRFLERKLKRKIEIGAEAGVPPGRRVIAARPEYTREGAERQKRLFRATKIFGAAALAAFLLTVLGYQYIYKPVMAKRTIEEGTALIRRTGDPVTAKVKDYNKAEELFKYVEEHYVKDYLPGYNAYARAYFDKKEYELSLRKLEAARRIDPANIETLNNLGYFYSKIPDGSYERMKPPDAKATRLETAINFYNMVLNRDRNNVTALFGIGNAYMGQGDYLKARQYYEDIVRVDPDSHIGYSGLLNLYIERDAMPEVISVHAGLVGRELLTEVPSALLAKLAAYYLGKKRTEDTNIRIDYGIKSSKFKDLSDNPYPAVRAVLEALHKRDSNYPPQYVIHAKLAREQKNLALMESYLNKALKLEPNYFAALSLMGEYHYSVNEPVKAYDFLNRAVKASASPPGFTFDDFYHETEKLGKTYLVLGNIFYYFFDKVKFRFGDELEEEEQDSSVEQLANYDIARDKYELARAEGFRSPELSYNLGRIYYMKGQYEKALEQWLDLYEDFVTRPELMMGLGNAFYHLDNLEAARGEYMKLVSVLEREAESVKTVIPDRGEHIRLFQTLSSAYSNLGAIYQRRGNEAKTNICYWKAIDYAQRLGRENEFARVNMARGFRPRTEPVQPVLDENIPFSVDIYSREMRK